MNCPFNRSLRIAARTLWLAGEVVLAFISFAAHIATHARIPDGTARARWLQCVCRRVLRVFHVQLRVTGPVPSMGLLVCNHLSYLDIFLLGATTPCVFVSKCEVKRWPVFGWFASLAGTLFLRRDKRSDVARVTREMRRMLDRGALVVLFPEGTTSDGGEVLPFKSSLIQPATEESHPVSAAFIEYRLSDGDVAEEVCYWKNMTFLPHLVNLFNKRSIDARLCFTQIQQASADRKQLARKLRSEVVRLKEALAT